jgi:hypothetical protein
MKKQDSRHIFAGREIPTESYSDQPYIVKTDDGAWLCCVTTGSGHEGAAGQHVTTLRSTDQGLTWSTPVPVEPLDSPENSYAVMFKASSGRIYIFYNHNTDNVREVKFHDSEESFDRVDSLGYFVFKYSDDHGRSWSKKRHVIPVREFACDRENIYGGKLRFFWNVGKPFIHNGAVYVSLHKVGQMGEGFFQQSEGALLKSDNLFTEPDPEKICWETLPDGDTGLRAPSGGGPIAEEQSYSVLSDGSFYCVYRSVAGYPVECYSRDGGHTWEPPRYMRYADGRLVKNPRAANFAWKCSNGKYLYWFHNHGGHFIRELWGRKSGTNGLVVGGRSPYDDRNPVWLCGGVEVNTPNGREIVWSQPEIVLYDDDTYVRMSYPDLIEEDGKFFLTETQKDKARVHELDPVLLAGLWGEADQPVASESLLLDLPPDSLPMPREIPAVSLPQFLDRDMTRHDYGTLDLRNGFTIEMELELPDWEPGQRLFDSRTPWGQGLALLTAAHGAIEIVLNDGRTESRWTSDPGLLRSGIRHHVAVIVDGGPKLILFVVDGILNDGGEHRQFGWGRFSPALRSANGGDTFRIASGVSSLRIHARALRVAEAAQLGSRL